MINTAETLLASRQAGAAGADGDNYSEIAALSGDGSWAAFETGADNFSTLDDDDFEQAYMRELDGDERLLHVSRPAGVAGAVVGGVGSTSSGGSSSDGRYIVFISRSDALLDNHHGQILVKDTVTGELTLASRANGPEGAPGDADSSQARIGADGSRVSFISAATNLVEGLPSTTQRAYVRDLRTGTTEVVSRAPDGSVPPDAGVFQLDLSGDGQAVAFTTAANLVPDDTGFLGDGDTDHTGHTHVRDLATGRTLLGSANSAGPPTYGNGDLAAELTADGRRVLFGTADPLDPTDGNGLGDVYERDLASGAVTLVTRANGAAGAAGNEASYSGVAPDADGSCVAFATRATNLVTGATPRRTSRRFTSVLSKARAARPPEEGAGAAATTQRSRPTQPHRSCRASVPPGPSSSWLARRQLFRQLPAASGPAPCCATGSARRPARYWRSTVRSRAGERAGGA
jgi:hypothetical protein